MTAEDGYFRALSEALKRAGLFRPVLVVDKDRLDANIVAVMNGLAPALSLRVVDKSLPSIPLLAHILAATQTTRIMSFHLPTTVAVLEAFPEADVLYGKPLPVGAVSAWMQSTSPQSFTDFVRRTVFLIDTIERLDQYAALASRARKTFRIAFEIDVGMHRGGFSTAVELGAAAARAAELPDLQLEGLMGYDAHITEVPGIIGGIERKHVGSRMKAFVSAVPQGARHIINTGGSKTALSYHGPSSANDVSVGSAFLKPMDFDVASLDALAPAVFIAAPVLKVQKVCLPGPAFLTPLMQMAGLFPHQGCFLYGGKWMAEPVFPPGMKESKLWGLSSNQQMMSLPDDSSLKPDDFAFFRPTQSEAVLQGFDTINLFSGDEMIERWKILPAG
ncbi:hypothetical protein RRU01S_01_00110 [Agrobacterium rubi TR3 = NBRC 13261]|uniref:Alanine racemase N-terminal domain-containing protein n=1 Tax=Agrobacterium rubi TR3 = NBRC 13261 TaxID=1368415 RepID=A0A081CPI8_9HYPH|nr:alanine racemase [Agrobacterium rubi]MBP1877616.1 D-serine deaminase-like pyridoxal phosphate-dependent protein [Agrobacterium rubi]MCL6654074.1 alanine racemase [Agrobacterium rubi]GAK68584.1 hypothetical protein RRU01S_01_00110 [Agrobacterium rubi TR3 = NBRC 13261]